MKKGYSNQGFGFNQVFLTSPSYGIAAGQLSNGIPYSPAALTATNFDPGAYPNIGSTQLAPAFHCSQQWPSATFRAINRLALSARSPNNLSVKVSFIDNRGVWLELRRADEYYKRTHSYRSSARNTVWTLPTQTTSTC